MTSVLRGCSSVNLKTSSKHRVLFDYRSDKKMGGKTEIKIKLINMVEYITL